jgi:hypothetical protein
MGHTIMEPQMIAENVWIPKRIIFSTTILKKALAIQQISSQLEIMRRPCDPAHFFKFAAELQSKGRLVQSYIDPHWNRCRSCWKPTSKTIEEQTDIYGFTLYNMGYKELPQPTKDVKCKNHH